MRPLLLPVVNVTGWELVPIQVAVTVSLMPDTADTVILAPDYGWRYHPKHGEKFTDINKLYIVVSCWIIITRNEKNCYQSSTFRSSGLFTFSINSAASTLQTSSRIPWQVTVAIQILACNEVMPDSNISQERKDNLSFLKVLLNRSDPIPGFRPRLFLRRFLPNPFQTHHSRYNSILCTLRFWERRKINHWGNSLVVESIEWNPVSEQVEVKEEGIELKEKKADTTLCDSRIRPRMITNVAVLLTVHLSIILANDQLNL